MACRLGLQQVGLRQKLDYSCSIATSWVADVQSVMQAVRSGWGVAGLQIGAMPALRHGGRREDG